MTVLRFHLDEDCQAAALAAALRAHAVDATTTNEVGKAGINDDSQLQHATSVGRVVLTNNIGDFSSLHDSWQIVGRNHAGIVLFQQQQYSIGEVVRRLLHVQQSLTAEDM